MITLSLVSIRWYIVFVNHIEVFFIRLLDEVLKFKSCCYHFIMPNVSFPAGVEIGNSPLLHLVVPRTPTQLSSNIYLSRTKIFQITGDQVELILR